MKKIANYLKYCAFSIIFVYLEILYKIRIGSGFGITIIYPIISAITLGLFISVISGLGSKKINRIIGYSATSIVAVVFCIQIVYRDTFKSPFSFSIAFGKAGGVNALTEFADITFGAIEANLGWILLALLSVGLLVIADRQLRIFNKEKRKKSIIIGAIFVATHIFGLISLLWVNDGGYSPKSLYYDRFIMDIGFDKLGVITGTKLDVKAFIFGEEEKLDEINDKQEVPTIGEVNKNEPESTKEEETTNSEGETSTEPEEQPVVYEPNILNIDLKAFSESTADENLKWLNDYIEAKKPTMKNEYTGMFEGYNVILLTAESFSPWAISEKYTPTLYKLANTGFVFNNFYLHGYSATIVGEYTLCTGLLPNGRGAASPYDQTLDKYMGMCMGYIMGNLGYSTNAYHNHTYTYYNRDKSHPNMGYIYKGKGEGGGLEIDPVWPGSDLQMMENSIDDYIDNEHFHAYYMTVSGHKNYTLVGNSMAAKNRKLVEDMEDSEAMQAYMACNIELDRALEYLIKRLEEKGIADKTVIAFAPDHYPYGLQEELTAKIGDEACKWYGLQKSSLIIWSASMKEPVVVDKVCSSPDVIPTLLNLLGIDYDSRLYSGSDILSDSPGLVIFNDMGFMTDYCIYKSSTGEMKKLKDIEIPEGYIDQIKSLTKNIWNAAGKIIQVDYYEKMKKYVSPKN